MEIIPYVIVALIVLVALFFLIRAFKQEPEMSELNTQSYYSPKTSSHVMDEVSHYPVSAVAENQLATVEVEAVEVKGDEEETEESN